MVTLQQIAHAADLGLATVSYALRNDPRIRPETRARVQELARSLGYRPNPRFSALMSHIRQSRPVSTGERIAFVWVRTPRSETETDPFLQRVFHGAKARAEALGYHVEQFWTGEGGMSDRRLAQTIRSRGIIGVVLSPIMHHATVTLDLDWTVFASAVIGSAQWNPELHHAGHHHYLAMRLTLEKLARLGARRPLAIIDAEVNERARRSWEAAFLVYHPVPSQARKLLLLGRRESAPALSRTLRLAKPDAIIVSDSALLDRLPARPAGLDRDRIVSLHWTPARPEVGGIDQSYDLIAANAVDLVVSQLNANETGIPEVPRILLFGGRWMDAEIAAAKRPKASSGLRSSSRPDRPD